MLEFGKAAAARQTAWATYLYQRAVPAQPVASFCGLSASPTPS